MLQHVSLYVSNGVHPLRLVTQLGEGLGKGPSASACVFVRLKWGAPNQHCCTCAASASHSASATAAASRRCHTLQRRRCRSRMTSELFPCCVLVTRASLRACLRPHVVPASIPFPHTPQPGQDFQIVNRGYSCSLEWGDHVMRYKADLPQRSDLHAVGWNTAPFPNIRVSGRLAGSVMRLLLRGAFRFRSCGRLCRLAPPPSSICLLTAMCTASTAFLPAVLRSLGSELLGNSLGLHALQFLIDTAGKHESMHVVQDSWRLVMTGRWLEPG